MSVDYLRIGLQVVTMIGAAIAALYARFVARTKATTTRIDNVDARVDDVEGRVLKAESDLKYTPSNAEIKELHKDIANLRGDMREISGSLTGLRRAVDLMNQHLLKTDTTSLD
ncbi:DUF2730 family protein [Salinisphaera orenii]|uniref:DUF2730 family protein n=1 Tax=Salinisphaera orenii TaxID=856731 RepID=UPI000DBE7ABA